MQASRRRISIYTAFAPRGFKVNSGEYKVMGLAPYGELNLKIKYRESFRPFAPSVLAEQVGEWFELDQDSPYMLLVANVRADRQIPPSGGEHTLFGIDRLNVPRSTIPAVTHVDYLARIQTVHRETNPRFHALIERFAAHTGCPVLVNTSFNVRGEPIVCTPEDAFPLLHGH